MNRPRVAYLLKKFPRLSETFVLNELLRLEEQGLGLRVFSRRPADEEPHHPQLARLQAEVEELPRNGQLDPFTELFVDSRSSQVSLDTVRRAVQELAGHGHPRLSRLFAEALWVRERTAALGIEHLHVHFATDSALVAMLVQELGGPSFSLTAHAKDIFRSSVNPSLLSRVVASSAFTVTVCDFNVCYLANLLDARAAAKVRRLYNGVDLSTFCVTPIDEREQQHILAVGRLVPKKGFLDLVQALILLRDRGLRPRLTLVGEGDQRALIEAAIAAAELGDQVRLTGPLDQGCVRELMQRATLFCLPCVVGEDGNRDALPTVLLEALASGLPCISTRVSGVPEILEEGRSGVIVAAGRPEDLAHELQRLLERPALRMDFAKAGRRHAERTFDPQDKARKLCAWMEEAVAAGALR